MMKNKNIFAQNKIIFVNSTAVLNNAKIYARILEIIVVFTFVMKNTYEKTLVTIVTNNVNSIELIYIKFTSVQIKIMGVINNVNYVRKIAKNNMKIL